MLNKASHIATDSAATPAANHLAVKPIIDRGQHDHSMDTKDRIIANLKADLRIQDASIAAKDTSIADLTSQIDKAKAAKKSKQEFNSQGQ